MSVRPATVDDLGAIEALWRSFEREVSASAHLEVDEQQELGEIHEIVSGGLGFVAEVDGEVAGFALARLLTPRTGRLTDLFVEEEARRSGLATALVSAVCSALGEHGVEFVELEVTAMNAHARAIYQRWGFVEDVVTLVAPVERLRERLGGPAGGVSFGSLHVQTDELGDVERAAIEFAPRIGSRGTRLEGPRNGWVTVYDEVVDRDPAALRRFARELSARLGAVVVALAVEHARVVRMIAFDRGGIVDEYLSVPEFYEPLPPGDVVGLAANPTVLARITGADPAAVRRVAVTGSSPDELPAPAALLVELAGVLGLSGAEHGYGSASASGEGA